MASFSFDIPDDFLSGLDLTDELAEEMINAAKAKYKDSIVRSARMSISTLPENVRHQTGEMLKNIEHRKAKKAKNGAYIANISFDGVDSKGVRNMLKAAELEYGNSHQDAKPFMQKAKNDCEQAILDKMQEVYNRRVGGE